MKENYQNIDELIVGYLTNDISEQELQTLHVWKAVSLENREQFDELERVWIKSGCLKTFVKIDTHKDWQSILKKLKSQKQVSHSPKRILLSVHKIAAIMIPFIFMVAFGFMYWNVPGFGRLSALQTGTTIQVVTLPDGSKITLNQHSKIIYPKNIASAAVRHIELSGEAFFEVTHNNTPFQVSAKQAIIEVLGTQFNVQQHNEEVLVSVISGKVSVSANQEQVELSTGERAQYTNGKLIQESTLTVNDIFWCSKQLIFKQANLSSICKQLQSCFPQIKKIQYKVKDLSVELTSSFKEQSLDEILQELEIHFDKKITFDGTTLTVSD